MKESELIQMRNRVANMEKVLVAVILRLEKLEGVEKKDSE
jgi:hypothetical protein